MKFTSKSLEICNREQTIDTVIIAKNYHVEGISQLK